MQNRVQFALAIVSALAAGGLVAPSLRGQQANAVIGSCYPINLRTGITTPPPAPFIEFVVPPEDSNGDGWYETVLKIRVGDPLLTPTPKAAQFIITYDSEPKGMTVNIGDSQTNDGYSGDAGTQSNDAELQVGGRLDLPEEQPHFDDLLVFGKDGTTEARGVSQIAQVDNIVKSGETVALTVYNEGVGYRGAHSVQIQSPWLYALNGQPDSEGPVNYDIYASFNRVIAGNYRSGSGVGHVVICLRRWVLESSDQQAPLDHQTSPGLR